MRDADGWPWPVNTQARFRPKWAGLLWTLYERGSVENRPTGRCASMLAGLVNERAGYELVIPHDVTYMLKILDTGGPTDAWPKMIERTMGGKRTYEVRMLDWVTEKDLPPCPFGRPVGCSLAEPEPEHEGEGEGDEEDHDAWIAERLAEGRTEVLVDDSQAYEIPEAGEGVARLRALMSEGTMPAATAAEPANVVLKREPEPELDPAVVADLERRATSGHVLDRLFFAQQAIAESLLEVAQMEAASAAPRRGDIAERLGEALEENARLRRKVSAANETAVSRMREAEALRVTVSRLNAQMARMQANLNAAMKGEGVPEASGFRALDNMMRERPRATAG